MYILSERKKERKCFKALSKTLFMTSQSSRCYALFMPDIDKNWPFTL